MKVGSFIFHNRFEIQNRINQEELLLQSKENAPDESRSWLWLILVILIVGLAIFYIYNEFSAQEILLPLVMEIVFIIVLIGILVRKPGRTEIIITNSMVIIRYFYYRKQVYEKNYAKEKVFVSFFTTNFPYLTSFASHILLKIGKDKIDLLFFVSEFNEVLKYLETLKDYKMVFDEDAQKLYEFLKQKVG